MATRIYLNQLAGNMHFDVEESFNEVINKAWPLKAPSQIEARSLCTFTLAGTEGAQDGRRIFIQSLNLVAVEENVDTSISRGKLGEE